MAAWLDTIPCDGDCEPGECEAAGMVWAPSRIRVELAQLPADVREERERRWTIAGCPVRALSESWQASVVLRLAASQSMGQLSAFVDGVPSAWVTRGLMHLSNAQAARRREEHPDE